MTVIFISNKYIGREKNQSSIDTIIRDQKTSINPSDFVKANSNLTTEQFDTEEYTYQHEMTHENLPYLHGTSINTTGNREKVHSYLFEYPATAKDVNYDHKKGDNFWSFRVGTHQIFMIF